METKPWYQSKVLWINIFSGLAAFLEGQQFTNVIPDYAQPYAAMAVFALNIVLRYITTTEIKSIMGNPSSTGKLPMWIVAVIGSAAILSGCATKKPAVLVGQAGVITVDTINQVSDAVIALNLPRDKELKIQRALLAANGKLAPVPDLILAIDNATKAGEAATTQVDKALAYLAEGAKYLDSVRGDLNAVPTAAAVMALVLKIQNAVTDVQAALERVKAPVPSASAEPIGGLAAAFE